MLLTVLLLHVGCATITKGTTDTIQVEVSNCGEVIECKASNKKGSWDFTAPGPVTFKKSDDNLVVTCQDGDNVITRRVAPTRGSMAWGNVLVGGIIGGGVDSATDAHWDMVDSVSIRRAVCHGRDVE